jgi:hypothetical protein
MAVFYFGGLISVSYTAYIFIIIIDDDYHIITFSFGPLRYESLQGKRINPRFANANSTPLGALCGICVCI